MSKEQRFYNALEGVFTGVQIEGDSGFVNLLKIKEHYYREMVQQFKDDITKERLLENTCTNFYSPEKTNLNHIV